MLLQLFETLMAPLFNFIEEGQLIKGYWQELLQTIAMQSRPSIATRQWLTEGNPAVMHGLAHLAKFLLSSWHQGHGKSVPKNHHFSVFWKLKSHLISLRDNPAAVPCSDTIMKKKKTRMNFEPSLGLTLYLYFLYLPLQAYLHETTRMSQLFRLGLVFLKFCSLFRGIFEVVWTYILRLKEITILKFTLATRAWAENHA